MRKQRNAEKSKKLRLVRIVIIELIVMVVSVCVSIMPMPYRLIVPIIIGARSILIKAHQYSKTLPASGIAQNYDVQETKPNKRNKSNVQSKEKDGGKAIQKATRTKGEKDK